MPIWLSLSKSPLFRFTLVLVVLSLLRLALLSLWEMSAAVRRAGDRRIPYGRIFRETLGWAIPVARIHRIRGLYSFASFSFHTGMLISAIFLGNHIDIFQESFGISWPALTKPLLDILTLLAIMSGSYLLLHRIYAANSRKLSKIMDYLLLVLLLNIFLSGFLGGQTWNPIPYSGLMLFHIINGFILMILIPFTKVSHCVLYPLIRLGTETAWHFPAQGGSEAVKALHGTEGRRI